MDVLERFGASGTSFGTVVMATVLVYVAVVVLARLAGPRSLAKMSSYDFAATVAVGSTLSSTALASVPLVHGLAALVVLFGLQATIGTLRRRGVLGGVVDNAPLLLLEDGVLRPAALAQARVSAAEVMAQVRLSGIGDLSQVRAVVLETTGSLSVLAGGPVDPRMLEGVRR